MSLSYLTANEFFVQAAVIGAPGRKALPLSIELIGEIDIGLAVEQIAKV
jgi:hypothetical protein